MERLQEYKKRLILFPRRNGKAKQGDASKEEVKSAQENAVKSLQISLPITNKAVVEEGKISDYQGEENAFRKLRIARSDARLVGVRQKRAQAKADEKDAAKK